MSPDRQKGVVVIAFVGSVFSPYYFSKRAQCDTVDPMDFCAFNVALYDRGKRIWGFSEWQKDRISRSDSHIAIGANRIQYDGDRVVIHVREKRVGGLGRIDGQIRLFPRHVWSTSHLLTEDQAHKWHPISPLADIEVDFDTPAWQFKGSGYHDANMGNEPLEASLDDWSWSRHEVDGDTVVFYDVSPKNGAPRSLALCFRADGTCDTVAQPKLHRLPNSFWWRCPRTARSDNPKPPKIIRTLEDSPFYSRTILESSIFGRPAFGVHESLNLHRFVSRWMQWMLPFRIDKKS